MYSYVRFGTIGTFLRNAVRTSLTENIEILWQAASCLLLIQFHQTNPQGVTDQAGDVVNI
jgi:hypothetical protein